ncbi:MAG: 1-acyl-sn-glycerol-3-phosphate acyltransferase [Microbacteriaceae bacterium]|nr:1-acyl-sn-glycerol-3-phosphate acyltransferase [Microbacteriaceae bacterium]
MIYWLMKYIIVGPILLLLYRPKIKGKENLPKEGGVILASNHLSFVDSIFLPLVLPRSVSFLAKSEYFTGKGIKGFFTRLFMKATGQLPMDRSGGQASADSLNTGLEVLAAGRQLGIYPEGTRSPDGKLYRGRTGVARMILESNVPVVPVAMIDTELIMPIGAKLPKIKRVGITFGEPIEFSRFQGLEGDRFILRSITDEIIYSIMEISGQEYEDIYASSIRQKMDAEKARRKVSANAR